MIIRMAKVEIVGPKQDLLNTLDLLHNRGIFQPDPQLLERVELADDDRLQALVLDDSLPKQTAVLDRDGGGMPALHSLGPPVGGVGATQYVDTGLSQAVQTPVSAAPAPTAPPVVPDPDVDAPLTWPPDGAAPVAAVDPGTV